jgi:hypothetical protein
MLTNVADMLWFRVVLGVFFGVPVTAIGFIGALFGAIYLYAGVREGNAWALGLGLVAVLGLLGIVGAWWRVLKPVAAMVARERLVVRMLLASGVAASLFLGALAVQADEALLVVPFALIAVGGMALVIATPTAL